MYVLFLFPDGDCAHRAPSHFDRPNLTERAPNQMDGLTQSPSSWKQLEGGRTLADCGFRGGSTHHVSLGLDGGKPPNAAADAPAVFVRLDDAPKEGVWLLELVVPALGVEGSKERTVLAGAELRAGGKGLAPPVPLFAASAVRDAVIATWPAGDPKHEHVHPLFRAMRGFPAKVHSDQVYSENPVSTRISAAFLTSAGAATLAVLLGAGVCQSTNIVTRARVVVPPADAAPTPVQVE